MPDPAPTPDLPRDPLAHYRRRREAARVEGDSLEAVSRRLSHLRLAAFFAAAIPLLLLETLPADRDAIALGIAGLGAIGFLVFLVRHRRARTRLRLARLLERISGEGEARIGRRWSELPPPPLMEAPRDHPSAEDLDLVGWGSLAHLIGRVSTAPGRGALRALLLDPFAPFPAKAEFLLDPGSASTDPTEGPAGDGVEWRRSLEARQESIRALTGSWEWRERFELLARSVEGEERLPDAQAFLAWAVSPPFLEERRWLRWVAVLLAVGTPLSLASWILGWVPGFLPLVGSLTSLGLHQRFGAAIHAHFDAAEGGECALRRWELLLEQMERLPGDSEGAAALGDAVRLPPPGAATALRRLLRTNDWAAMRRSSLAHFPLVALFAWDLHILGRIERWQRRFGSAVSEWLRGLGEAEALAALAGLAHDHPGWSFPAFSEDVAGGISVEAMAHPLLPPDRAVPNAAELPGPGRILLVTGSNMAGKTTLLRALGVNQVLALAGAPVAASAFRTRWVLPWTTISVRDDLREGVSLFLAELQRLRRVVDAAERRPVLYLLDEILHGTNSAERQIAARIVLERLLRTQSIGAVTTHDLALADTPALQAGSLPVHFRESVVEEDGKRILTFDYRLRPGPATSRNALLLLELAGLGGGASATADPPLREDRRSPEGP